MSTGVIVRRKFRIGHIFSLIIAFLEITYILYRVFQVDIAVLDSFIRIIEDCSAIFTIICISFGVISLAKQPKAYSLTVLCLFDIVLANDLYSNQKLLQIVQWFSSRKSIFVIVLMIVCVTVVICIWRISSRKKASSHDRTADYFVDFEDVDEETADANFHEQETYGHHSPQNKSKREHNSKMKAFDIFRWICTAVCVFIALWGVLDYLLFVYFDLGINRPDFLAWVPSLLYYGTIISLACMVALHLVCGIIASVQQKPKGQKGIHSFRGSALAAIVLEVASIYAVIKLDIDTFHDGLLSAMTDNLFSSFLLIVLMFFILQIICTMLYHLIFKNSAEDAFVRQIKASIIRIEEKLVKLAFSLLEGCINLFDFIPDFFDTIGIILLDKKNEQDNES